MKVPFVDLQLQISNLRPELDTAIAAALDRAAFINGPFLKTFESEFAAFSGAAHAIGVSSGTSALHLALRACGVGPGDAVITTPHTFIATTEAVIHAGAEPVFVDVLEDSGLIDPDKIQDAITPRVKAILPVHLYGRPCDMRHIAEIARANRIAVIEDAAQAHGATLDGRPIGVLSSAACFSFFPGKNLGAFGDAGAVATMSDDIAADIRSRANHGRREKYLHEIDGYNYRMDDLQAAILSVKLRHLADWNKARIRCANAYDERLSGLPRLITPLPNDERTVSVYHLYVVRHPRRDALREHLKTQGIDTGVHYPVPLHKQPVYAGREFAQVSLPIAERLSSEILSLPIFPEITDDQISRVCAAVESFCGAGG